MIDFASALYLGMRHPSAELGQWDALTLGRPSASTEPPGAPALAAALARLSGFEAATLLPSTLHLFCDLFAVLGTQRIAMLADAASYPVALWGAQRFALGGTPLRAFPHADAAAAWRMAQQAAADGRRPVILADGYFPGADKAPPLAAYADIAARLDGYLVLDDTQAFGLFGRAPGKAAPYGSGGGGSARLHALAGAHVVVGASLAKGFGAPLSVLCASAALVRRFEQRSASRVHSSPPSVAAVRAGLNALRLNREHGERRRWHLWHLVAHWRACLARAALTSRGGMFPVQTPLLAPGVDGAALHAQLERAGIDTVLQQVQGRAAVTFLMTANHTRRDVERAAAALLSGLRNQGAAHHVDREAV